MNVETSTIECEAKGLEVLQFSDLAGFMYGAVVY